MNEAKAASTTSEADQLFALAYGEIKKLARYARAGRGPETLNTTALAHDAFLKVRSHAAAHACDSGHLKALVTRAMRQILVDHARSARAEKHGGAQRPVTLEGIEAGGGDGFDLVAVDAALRDLEALDPRCAKVVEMHVFGGFTMPEIAEALQLTERTVFRDWRKARAILVDRLG